MRALAWTKATGLLVAALLALGFATSSSANHDPNHPHRDIPPIGGQGNAAFNDVCKDGGYMIGVRVYLGAWVDHIEMVCSDARSDFTWRPRFVSGYGGDGGGYTPKVGLCKDGWILTGLRMRFTKNSRQLHSIYGTCRAVAPDTTGGGGWAIYPDNQQAAATEDALRGITCRDGEAAAGMSGRYGDHVNAIGLNCRKYPPSFAVGPTPKKVEPKPEKSAKIDGMIFCQGGGMKVGSGPKNLSIILQFKRAEKSSKEEIPGPGECAWSDRPIRKDEPRHLYVPLAGDAKNVVEAGQNGGIFLVSVRRFDVGFWVETIHSVDPSWRPQAKSEQNEFVKKRIDRAKARGAANGDDGAGFAAAPADRAVASAECPAGFATVTTSQVGEDVLNVRAKPSRDAEIVAQVADGSQVSVTGACFTGGAGFAKGKTLKPKGDGGKAKPDQNAQVSGGWCRIDEPAQGCVKAEFLAFGQAPKTKGAGLAKAKTLKPQDGGNADETSAQGLTFTGKWSVTGDDDVEYSMTMTQKGTSVSGNYRGGDGSKGSFSGKVKGNVLKFAWKQADGYSGSGKFALSDDGQSFDGSYSFGKNPDEAEGSWSGTRQ